MSQKPEESTHDALFDGHKLNYQFLVVNLKFIRASLNPDGDKLETTREKFEKNSAILLNLFDLPLMATKHINIEKVKPQDDQEISETLIALITRLGDKIMKFTKNGKIMLNAKS